MDTKTIRPKEALSVTGLTLCLIALFPLLAIGLFFLRFAFLAAALVALIGGVVLIAVSQRFRRRFLAVVESSYDYKGLHLSTDVGLDTAHSWARVEPDGAFVGVDDLAASCLGPLDRVELPALGQRVHRGEPLVTLGRGGRRLAVRSPVTGTVTVRNEALPSDPERVNRDPFGLGWVARIRTDDARASRRRLMRGIRAQDWFRDEVDRLVATLGAGPSAVPTLPDGGVLVDGLYRAIDGPTWRTLQQEFFAADREAETRDSKNGPRQ